MDWPLKFGIFLAPFHPVGQNPTLALERDLELIEHLDSLGFDEAWIGEHHSAGYEIIASPEVFIAAAAQRTKHIRLGTGVSSLPYHQPLMLADRMVLLDHLTRGRVMFGVGPGALPSDAFMMGIDGRPAAGHDGGGLRGHPRAARRREAGQPHRPTGSPSRTPASSSARTPIRASRSRSPPRCRRRARAWPAASAPRCCRSAPPTPGGFDVLGAHWTVMEERAAEFGTTVDRRKWRLVGPMHIADTKEQAYEDVRVRPPAVGRLLPARRRPARSGPDTDRRRRRWPTP